MKSRILFNLTFKITLILSIYMFASCRTNKSFIRKENIPGTYVYKPHRKAFSSRMQLHENGEFILEQHLGSDKPSYNKGHWKVLKNGIEINSIIQPFKQIQQIEDSISAQIKVINFHNNKPILFANLEILSKKDVISKISESDFDGLAYLQFSDLDSILIVDEIGYLKVEIPINRIKGKMIELTLHEDAYSYYITDEFWEVSLKKLKRTVTNHKGDKETNIYTKKGNK